MDSYISVQPQDFDLSHEVNLLQQQNGQVGAVASFVGVVRDVNEGQQVATMELEHYAGMTERSIDETIQQAAVRWKIIGARVIHRVGKLAAGDQIVLVAVSSMHRGDAFAACEFIMDYLKTRAPFWKKELGPNGEHWVDARISDAAAAERWK
ncbi:molybdopterin synthase catalytic subunit MoaE [Oceanicoccus sp. KOV_DT_Chl]|uniref:molybdopterin synthase catalytic subunit MoaE n=1 Tax=Oceanicoccus sp. KOV_DT_Chl TaxID=1904639 RepID=UPI000C7A4F1C|nr:molybdopterin synthase catalytic subunit MoaE [Oceanicoccus sp. KOV_DT_Chl]